jgi:uncharacterized membrane protein
MFAGVLLVVQPTFLKRLLQIDTGDSCHSEGITNNASLSKGVVSKYSILISENHTALENMTNSVHSVAESMNTHVENSTSAGFLKTVQQKARDDIIGKTTLSIKLAMNDPSMQKNVTLKMNDVTAKNFNVITENNKVTKENNHVTTENNHVTTENNHVTTENNHVTTENNNVTTENNSATETENATAENNNATTETENVTSENDNVTTENTRVTTRNNNVSTKNKNGTTENNIPQEIHHESECSKRWNSGMDIKISHFVGCLLTVVASLAASFLIIFSRKVSDVSASTMIAQTNLVTAVAAVFSTTVSGTWTFPARSEPWLWVAANAVLFILAQGCLYLSLKYEAASVIAMVRTAEIPCVFILQVLFIHRIPNSLDLIGASVVMCSVLAYGGKRVCRQRSAVAAQSAGYSNIENQCEDE